MPLVPPGRDRLRRLGESARGKRIDLGLDARQRIGAGEFETGELLLELADAIELAVDRGETHIGHLVDVPEVPQGTLPDHLRVHPLPGDTAQFVLCLLYTSPSPRD